MHTAREWRPPPAPAPTHLRHVQCAPRAWQKAARVRRRSQRDDELVVHDEWRRGKAELQHGGFAVHKRVAFPEKFPARGVEAVELPLMKGNTEIVLDFGLKMLQLNNRDFEFFLIAYTFLDIDPVTLDNDFFLFPSLIYLKFYDTVAVSKRIKKMRD